MHRVRFLNNKFIVVGEDGDLRHSSDGQTWTRVIVGGGSLDIWDIGFDGTTYVVAMDDSTLMKSTDLSSWSTISHGKNFGGAPFYSITYGGGKWVVGARSSDTYPEVMYSSDLSTWTTAEVSGLTSGAAVREIIYAESKYVALFEGEFTSKMAAYSSDAASWTLGTLTFSDSDWADKFKVYAMCHTGSKFIAVGQGLKWSTKYSDYYDSGQGYVVSDDGQTWAAYRQNRECDDDLTGICVGASSLLCWGEQSAAPWEGGNDEEVACAHKSVGLDPTNIIGVIVVDAS